MIGIFFSCRDLDNLFFLFGSGIVCFVCRCRSDMEGLLSLFYAVELIGRQFLHCSCRDKLKDFAI